MPVRGCLFGHGRRPGEGHGRDKLILAWRLKPDGRILALVAHGEGGSIITESLLKGHAHTCLGNTR